MYKNNFSKAKKNIQSSKCERHGENKKKSSDNTHVNKTITENVQITTYQGKWSNLFSPVSEKLTGRGLP